jgi:N-methylhydantoinase A
LGLDLVETAHGIVEIANAAMVNALRLVSVQRGYDPREFVLVAFGGAGPVHANRLAAEIETPITVIPLSPGTTSALGLLVTDLKHDYSTTMIARVDRLDVVGVEQVYRELERQGRATLEREGVPAAEMSFLWQVDMRYVGQSYELTLSWPNNRLDAAELAHILEEFQRAHDRAYGFSAPGEPVELVNLRLTAIGKITKPSLRELRPKEEDLRAGLLETRPVYFAESGGYVDCPVYDRYRLSTGHRLNGPAIVVELDSTTVIHPGYQAEVDKFGNLILSLTPPKSRPPLPAAPPPPG